VSSAEPKWDQCICQKESGRAILVMEVKESDARMLDDTRCGVPVFRLFSMGVGKGKGRHACKSIDMCGGPWEDRRTSFGYIYSYIYL